MKPAEENLIDLYFGEENASAEKVDSEAVGDGWDEDVWADIDDDQWEPIEHDDKRD